MANRIELPQFIWIAQNKTTKQSIIINSKDVSNNVLSSFFTIGLIGENVDCEIDLENSGETYTGEFSAGNIVQFKMDFGDGDTIQWEGKIEQIQSKHTSGQFILTIKGSHYQANLLDITVTAEFTNSIISDILKNIIDNNLTGFTYTNVQTINKNVNKIKWNNKPFLDCVIDLMILGDVDCFVDNNKDFNLFLKGFKTNENEAIVWDDNLIELVGLGTDSVDVRNKIIVYGEAGGLPVLHTSEDNISKTAYGVKEKVITDTSLIDENQAKEVGDAENFILKNPPTKGSATSFFMPQLSPGDLLYVVHPPLGITNAYRLIKYTFKVPDETMESFFSQDVGIPQLFKERIKKDTQQEKLINPFKMLYSYNFTFDDLNKASSTTKVEVLNGKLKLVAGASTGTFISLFKTTPITVSKVSLQLIGEALDGATYSISADGSDNFQNISANTEQTVVIQGNQLGLKIIITSSSTQIDSAALLYK